MSRAVAPATEPGSPSSAAPKPSRSGPSHTLARYAVPLLFAALCLGGILVARITPSFLLSEMLVREQRQSLPEFAGITQDLDRIHTSAQHLGRLISDVLDLASSEAGQLRLMREPLDLCEVLRVTVMTGEQMAREKGLHWQVGMPQEAPWVLGDRTRLRQVVLNLLSNAVKFTASGAVMLSVTVDAGHATVAVSDTGIGVPIAEQAGISHEHLLELQTTRSELVLCHGRISVVGYCGKSFAASFLASSLTCTV